MNKDQSPQALKPSSAQVIGNATWLIGDRLLRLLLGLGVTVALTRFLGPEQFGLLMFATALIGIAVVASSLGLQGVVVQRLALQPETSGAVLASGLVLRLAAAALAAIVVVAAAAYPAAALVEARPLVLILSLSVVFQSFEVLKYWFEARVTSKFVVRAELLVFVFACAARLYLVWIEAALQSFAWLALAESLLMALAVVAIYGIGGERLSRHKLSLQCIASLLRQSWPLLLASMAVVVYMRIDQVMIAMLANTYEVGIYSAAVRISEVWYFVPGAIVASTFPVLLAQRQSDTAAYERNLQYLYTAVVAISLVVALIAMLGSGWAVEALFGNEFSAAAPILMVHIWAGLFVALGVTSGRWLIAEGLQRIASYRTLAGAIINVGLNYLLIPRLGALGAAVATVVSFSIAAFWSDVLFQSTRRVFLMKVRAIFLLDLGSLAAQLARLVGAAARN